MIELDMVAISIEIGFDQCLQLLYPSPVAKTLPGTFMLNKLVHAANWSIFSAELMTAVGPFMSVPTIGEMAPSANGVNAFRPSGSAPPICPRRNDTWLHRLTASYDPSCQSTWEDSSEVMRPRPVIAKYGVHCIVIVSPFRG